MTKILATCAALAITAAFAMPGPAVAKEKRADGVRNQDTLEVSDHRRRYRRYGYRYYGPRYGYYRGYYNAPYYAYAPRYRYRPYYYGPRVGVGVGPFGFGFGW